MSLRVSMTTLGCAKNLSDSESMLGLLLAAGHQIASTPSLADICIVNTCTFIAESTQQSLDALIDLADQGKKLIVAGCLAQRYQEELFNEIPEVQAILGTGDIEQIINAVHWVSNNSSQKSFLQEKAGHIANSKTPRIRLTNGLTAYVKISEGCNHRCAFCIIPSLRGNLKSRSIEDIVDEIKELADNGVQEVMLVSQDSTAYGIDIYGGQWRLAELLEAIATQTSMPWIRLMYSYPGELSEKVLEVIARHDSLLNYIDIPLQHSHPETLRRMRRPLYPEHSLEKIRKHLPQAAIRSTFIVGFPGETEEEFEHLLDFLKREKLDRVGVFTYSQEDSTQAARFINQIPEEIKKHRQKLCMQAQYEIIEQKHQKLQGSLQRVLVEKISGRDLIGRTFRDAPEIDSKVIISLPETIESPELLLGELVDVRVSGIEGYDLQAELYK